MEKEAELKLKEFDHQLKEKSSVKDYEFWRLFIISSPQFFLAVYNNTPLEKRKTLLVRFILIKLLLFALGLLVLGSLVYLKILS